MPGRSYVLPVFLDKLCRGKDPGINIGCTKQVLHLRLKAEGLEGPMR